MLAMDSPLRALHLRTSFTLVTIKVNSVLSCSYLDSKILWDGKFLSFPYCKYNIFNGPVLCWKSVLSTDLVKPSYCTSKCSVHVFWPLPPDLGAGSWTKAGTKILTNQVEISKVLSLVGAAQAPRALPTAPKCRLYDVIMGHFKAFPLRIGMSPFTV